MPKRISLAFRHFRAGIDALLHKDYYRWRKLDIEVPPSGARVDLKQNYTTGADSVGYYFGLITIVDDMCQPCSWNSHDEGRLVLSPEITMWRYSE